MPSLLLFNSEWSLSDLNFSDDCVLCFEPHHDLLSSCAQEIALCLLPSALAVSVCEYLGTLWKKMNLHGSDLIEAVVEEAHILCHTLLRALHLTM